MGCSEKERPISSMGESNKIIYAANDSVKRMAWKQPASSNDVVRQDEVLGWFIAQLSPSEKLRPPAHWSSKRKEIASAIEGKDLSFPLEAGREIVKEASENLIIEAWTNAILLQNDPHARYLPEEKARVIDKSLRIYDEGIGLTITQDQNGVVVSSISPASPASEHHQLSVGSRLIAWKAGAGNWIYPANMQEWRDALSGEVGSKISLRWMDGKNKEIEGSFTRSWWSLSDRRATGSLTVIDNIPVGIVKIPLFYFQNEEVNTSADILKERDRLRQLGAKVLVLDLRGNPGGYWKEAVASAGAFTPGVPFADAVMSSGVGLELKTPLYPHPWQGPVLILVNKDTASAAEVLAGFLKKTAKTCVVGERTYGKGSIQVLSSLDPPFEKLGIQGQIVLTTMFYRFPWGDSPQYWGITPDVWTEDHNNSWLYGERLFPNAIKFGSRPVEKDPVWNGVNTDLLTVALENPICQNLISN